jgi:predicted amidohydrolase
MSQPHRRLHVACGQIVSRPGDLAHNVDQIGALAARAAAHGARLMLFAEGALTGYLLTPANLALAPTLAAPEVARLRTISQLNELVLVVGTLLRDDAGLHMSALIVYPDGQVLVQHKHCLTPKELAAKLVPGAEERVLFQVDGVTAAVCICADGGIKDIYNKLAARGCQIYVAPTAGGAGREYMMHSRDLADTERRKAYLASMEKVCFLGPALATCYQHRMALMACNLAGDDGVSNYHPGHSSIIDSRGCMVGLIPGEYAADYLRPQWIGGEIVVQAPQVVPAAG